MPSFRPVLNLDFRGAGWMDRRGVLRRTHSTGARAMWQDGAGLWRFAGPSSPRWAYDAAGRRIGLRTGAPTRTNGVRNPGMVGTVVGVVGAGGALPTNWSLISSAGLTCEVLALPTINGMPCIRLKFSGTASATAMQLAFETTTAITAAPSQQWAGALPHLLDAASAPPLAHQHRIVGRTSGGATVSPNTYTQALTPGAALTRTEHRATLNSDATLARVNSLYVATLSNGAGYDWTITLGAPTLEQASYATLPILPAAGATGAATRNVEVLTFDLARLGLAGIGAEGTMLVSARTAPVNNAAQTFARLTDGSGDHITLRRSALGLAQLDVYDGGVLQAGLDDPTAIAAGADTTIVASWAPGSFTLTRGGAAEVLDASGTVPAVSSLILGASDADAEPANMILSRFALWDRQLPSATRLALAS